MKNGILILLSITLLSSCFWGDEETSNKKITKDFWLNWWADSTDQHLVHSTDIDGSSGSVVIDKTVFALGFNDNFIIAKQHPDKESEVSSRLFNIDTIENAYLLSNPADTIWLSKDDSIYTKNGKWFHSSNGWNPPDSLKPYKAITYYHIIDIRKYSSAQWNSYKVYTFDNKNDFINKRHELGVPERLSFTIKSPSLE